MVYCKVHDLCSLECILNRPHIILVHGMWMTGIDMSLLRYRLRRYGYQVSLFSYPSVRLSLTQNAERLNKFVQSIARSQCGAHSGDALHFVAHSLGGLLIRQLFHDYPQQRPGRVVTLGTPHQGSMVVKRLSRYRMWRALFGKSLHHGLLGDVPAWHSDHEIGVLAGRLSVGMGNLVSHLPRPNDGTVALVETPLNGMSDYKVLKITHMSMLVLPIVAREVHQFLSTGTFVDQDKDGSLL